MESLIASSYSTYHWFVPLSELVTMRAVSVGFCNDREKLVPGVSCLCSCNVNRRGEINKKRLRRRKNYVENPELVKIAIKSVISQSDCTHAVLSRYRAGADFDSMRTTLGILTATSLFSLFMILFSSEFSSDRSEFSIVRERTLRGESFAVTWSDQLLPPSVRQLSSIVLCLCKSKKLTKLQITLAFNVKSLERHSRS